MRFFSDGARHLVCWPYSVPNLHEMAAELDIDRCWFHPSSRLAHYDIPLRRIAEISAKTEIVSSKIIVAIIQGYKPPDRRAA